MTGDLYRYLAEQRVADLLREGERERRATSAPRRERRWEQRIARPTAHARAQLRILRARPSGR